MTQNFLTEKQTEYWLTSETRDILMPDGTREPYTDFKMFWGAFDFVLEETEYDEVSLASLAEGHMIDSGKPFKEAFMEIVVYIDKELRKRLGIDE